MSFLFSWDKQALRDLEKLEILMRKRIIKKIIWFAENGSFHDVKRMTGYVNTYRLRVGNYRVILEMVDGGFVVLKIGHRGKIY